MSWQSYVTDHLVKPGMVSAAAIIGHDGQVWAKDGLDMQSDEGRKLVEAFVDPSGVLAQGLHIGGIKFMTIRADTRSIYGKKQATGVVTVKTKMAVIVSYYTDTIQPGQATYVTEKLADYLIESGF
eukprot:comp20197_c0_seq6/m.39969 comp20197_c0_seq6/g.39969  ORF comp20197_c0_seq6/g.39969 comp20197_c0_seq6/m.39969 type:complete len:126 (-) comp20197_c0_seq6:25-402(-)